MSTTCTDNSSCGKGSCCEVFSTSPNFQTCTSSPTRCYTEDGSSDFGVQCEDSSECATECCQSVCVAQNIDCEVAPFISIPLLIGLIVAGVFMLILIFTIVMCCCCERRKRKKRKSEKVIPQEQKTQTQDFTPDKKLRKSKKPHQIFSKIAPAPRKNSSTTILMKPQPNRKSSGVLATQTKILEKTDISPDQSSAMPEVIGIGEFVPILNEPQIKSYLHQKDLRGKL